LQSIFKRYEAKYLITQAQCAALSEVFSREMALDRFDDYLVQNLYYDTEHWDIIRRSMEKPLYKEKLRLRCYGEPSRGTKFFLELKKKHQGIVHKRRIAFSGDRFSDRGIRGLVEQEISQISRELGYYLQSNPIVEKMYISHKRRAFSGVADKELRVTLDTDVRYRLHDLNFRRPDQGTLILPPEMTLMEIKVPGGMPLWLARALSANQVYPTSFSKFGTCYMDYMQKQRERRMVHV